MNIAVLPDGRTLDTRPTVTKPGDHVIFRAEMDCIVAFSACPQDIVKIQGAGDNTPKEAHCAILDHGFADVEGTKAWVPAYGS